MEYMIYADNDMARRAICLANEIVEMIETVAEENPSIMPANIQETFFSGFCRARMVGLVQSHLIEYLADEQAPATMKEAA